MLEVVISSQNRHKVDELKSLFNDPRITIKTINEVVQPVPVFVEDGFTFEENACKKLIDLPLEENRIYMSDDSGLEVDFLGGKPGIHSARYAGEHATTTDMCQKILNDVKGAINRKARFVCVIALLFSDGRKETFRGTVDGVLALEMKGQHGFGYDPIFIPDGYQYTYAQLGDAVKQQTSHRAQALQLAKNRIFEYVKIL